MGSWLELDNFRTRETPPLVYIDETITIDPSFWAKMDEIMGKQAKKGAHMGQHDASGDHGARGEFYRKIESELAKHQIYDPGSAFCRHAKRVVDDLLDQLPWLDYGDGMRRLDIISYADKHGDDKRGIIVGMFIARAIRMALEGYRKEGPGAASGVAPVYTPSIPSATEAIHGGIIELFDADSHDTITDEALDRLRDLSNVLLSTVRAITEVRHARKEYDSYKTIWEANRKMLLAQIDVQRAEAQPDDSDQPDLPSEPDIMGGSFPGEEWEDSF